MRRILNVQLVGIIDESLVVSLHTLQLRRMTMVSSMKETIAQVR